MKSITQLLKSYLILTLLLTNLVVGTNPKNKGQNLPRSNSKTDNKVDIKPNNQNSPISNSKPDNQNIPRSNPKPDNQNLPRSNSKPDNKLDKKPDEKLDPFKECLEKSESDKSFDFIPFIKGMVSVATISIIADAVDEGQKIISAIEGKKENEISKCNDAISNTFDFELGNKDDESLTKINEITGNKPLDARTCSELNKRLEEDYEKQLNWYIFKLITVIDAIDAQTDDKKSSSSDSKLFEAVKSCNNNEIENLTSLNKCFPEIRSKNDLEYITIESALKHAIEIKFIKNESPKNFYFVLRSLTEFMTIHPAYLKGNTKSMVNKVKEEIKKNFPFYNCENLDKDYKNNMCYKYGIWAKVKAFYRVIRNVNKDPNYPKVTPNFSKNLPTNQDLKTCLDMYGIGNIGIKIIEQAFNLVFSLLTTFTYTIVKAIYFTVKLMIAVARAVISYQKKKYPDFWDQVGRIVGYAIRIALSPVLKKK